MTITFTERLMMRFRGTPVSMIRSTLRKAHEHQIEVTPSILESHHLAGGDPNAVIEAMIKAHDLGVPAELYECMAINLAGHDLDAAIVASSQIQALSFDD